MNPIKKNHDAVLRTGAMALAAAGASTAAHAATVQITFNNSFISTTSGNHLVTDVGGDGVADLFGLVNIGYFAGVWRWNKVAATLLLWRACLVPKLVLVWEGIALVALVSASRR